MKRIAVVSLTLCLVALLNSCTKKTETFTSAAISDYAPYQVGKVYIYRLDSTVVAPFGTALIVKSYQAKDSVESTFNDNQGRLSYRIFRYTRDTSGTQAWKFAATYYATTTSQSLEYVDNNMRFLKLHSPFTDGFSWKAHTYIDTRSSYVYFDDWNYEYQNLNQPYIVLNKTFDSTVTVFQHDETSPNGPFDKNFDRQDHNNGVEVYAKNIGLIYRDFLHWTWQKNPIPAFEDGSYGVKLRLISHN